MKVYVLIDTCKNDIEGVFTYDGKLTENKKLLEDARSRRTSLIDMLLEDSANVSEVADLYNKEIYESFADISRSTSNLLNTIALRDHAVAKLKTTRDRIRLLNSMSDEELITEFNKTRWEVRELQGD